MAKEPTKKADVKPDPAIAPRAARKEALATEQERVVTEKPRPDPQSGMDPTADMDAMQRRVAEQFKAADVEGQPRTKEEQMAVDEATLSRQIRGY